MNLEATLDARLRGSVVIVGVGNPLRGDDGAGGLLARRLRPAPGVLVIDAEEVPENHLGKVLAARPSVVLLVDAVDLGAPPGSVALLEARDLPSGNASTHRVPLRLLMDVLARDTWADVLLLAIQPRHADYGRPLSAEVQASVVLLADILNRILEPRRAASRSDPAGEQAC